MQSFRRFLSRLVAWRANRRRPDVAIVIPDFSAFAPSIARDVSRTGVRFFSLCATCGSRLQSSATLCEDCAATREWR